MLPLCPSLSSSPTSHTPMAVPNSSPLSFLLLELPLRFSMLVWKPQAPLLSLTLLILLNSLELFLMRGVWMNFRKLVNFSPPCEHAMFSLTSRPLWGKFSRLEVSLLLHPSPPVPPQHPHFSLGNLVPEICRHL